MPLVRSSWTERTATLTDGTGRAEVSFFIERDVDQFSTDDLKIKLSLFRDSIVLVQRGLITPGI